MHRRFAPRRHSLAYRVFMFLLDLDELAALDQGGFWFGYNRRALFSFYDADHGARDRTVLLKDWTNAQLAGAGIDCAGGSIRMLCFPRVLGYAFNPISILFCRDRDDRLRAVLYEVSNTFGEKHGYLFAVPDPCPAVIEQHCAKSFYVSPFLGMQADYSFRLSPPEKAFNLVIRHKTADKDILTASWMGRYHSWSRSALITCFWRYPLLTLKVITAIHWHGLLIFLKTGTFHRRPPLPQDRVSVETFETPTVNE
jgi:DUF1365 family protein